MPLSGGGLPDGLIGAFAAAQVYVSVRGDSIRVAPHVQNDPSDIERFLYLLRKNLPAKSGTRRGPGPGARSRGTMKPVIEYIRKNQDRYVEELVEYLAIPSISTLPEHAADVRRAAEWTARSLERAGLEHARVIQTPGHPLVYGEWLHASGAPTVLCYGHYDVQPVDPIDLWESPPFRPAIRNGKIYARGATDDKGQLFIHVKAIEAYLRQTDRLPVNVKVLIEGEEESGGAHLEAFVRANPRLLAADVIANSDSAMFAPGVPSITYGLRGLVYFQLEVRSASADLHSGSFGGAVPNAALAMAQIVAGLKDAAGRVTIPGFYDDVRPLDDEERRALAELPFDESRFRAGLGANELAGEAGCTTLERLWTRPTLDVNGFHSGFGGTGAKTVIPAFATAKVSMRLVPEQDPRRIGDLFEAHLASAAPTAVTLRVTRMYDGKPWRVSVDNRYIQAGWRAMHLGFGKRPVFVREGGSNPIVPVLEEVLGAPTVMFGIGSPDENPHAPNEHLDLSNFQRGIIAAAHLYAELGRACGTRTRVDQVTHI